MKDTRKITIEKVANIIVVVAIVVVTGIIAKKYLFDSNEPIQTIKAGKVVSFPDVDWARNGKTIVIAVKRDCPHCTASAPFFHQASDEASKNGITIEFVLPDSDQDTTDYLAGINISRQNIHKVPLWKYGFRATPTLLFINREGLIKDIWVGRIDSENWSQVLTKLNSLANSEPLADSIESNEVDHKIFSSGTKPISTTELNAAIENGNDVFIVDVDSREDFKNLHISKAKNIPSDEIQIRAPREIPKDKRIVFYGRCPVDSASGFSQQLLEKIGYSDVAFLKGGLKGWQNSGFPVEKYSEISQ